MPIAEPGNRLAGMRAADESRERRRRLALIGAIAVILALVVGLTVRAILVQRTASSPSSSVPGVRTFDVPSRNHVKGKVQYPQTPPVGGDHSKVWLNCGFYTSPVPNENAVHDMEHGAVWITYRPELPQSQSTVLKALAAEQSYITVSPFDGLPSPVVASAWGVQLQLDKATDPALDDFVQTYRLGSQAPEPGAPCTGGIGQPLL